ncbi:glycosyltransferase family 8 protein [Ceratobasidium sp. AG-Ba]|nr:glycosyltransferase family 8 protein [Ceratobasidium sp. AG-Ba]QRW11867.1 glycosyltransferase family 8 protein [Ceratobasidium sp. AG-Ba]
MSNFRIYVDVAELAERFAAPNLRSWACGQLKRVLKSADEFLSRHNLSWEYHIRALLFAKRTGDDEVLASVRSLIQLHFVWVLKDSPIQVPAERATVVDAVRERAVKLYKYPTLRDEDAAIFGFLFCCILSMGPDFAAQTSLLTRNDRVALLSGQVLLTPLPTSSLDLDWLHILSPENRSGDITKFASCPTCDFFPAWEAVFGGGYYQQLRENATPLFGISQLAALPFKRLQLSDLIVEMDLSDCQQSCGQRLVRYVDSYSEIRRMSSERTAADHAFVTLITSDDYLPGALAQSAALNDLHPTRRGGPFPKSTELEEEPNAVPFTTVCLVTPETVSIETIKQLRRTFDLVIGVEVIEGDKDAEEIKLLGRPDLHQTFTKLHVLRLVQFASVVFLDADVLPLRPLSHLLNMVSSWPDEYFGGSGDQTPTATTPATASSGTTLSLNDSSKLTRNPHRLHNPEFPCPISAAPDSGWPDIFNSGVIVLAPPGERGFKESMSLRSWDGGDQGTLNEWAGSQAGLTTQGTGGPGWNRLSFKYNVTPTAAYTYAPAYARFGTSVHAVHFIGTGKPWSGLPFRAPFISSSGRSAGKYVIGGYGSSTETKDSAYGYHALVDRWFAVYDAHYRVEESLSKSEFEVRHYESAWEGSKPKEEEFTAYDGGADSGAQINTAEAQANQYPHVVPPYTYHVTTYTTPSGLPPSSTSAATLEELRRLALQGSGGADAARVGEGAYISLPLEGRISLMRPQHPDPVPVFLHRPRAPEPEPQPEPQHHHHQPHHETHHYEPPHETHHHEHHHQEHHHHEQHHHEHHEHHHHETHHYEPPRPASPPMITWNPAVEPPPNVAPPQRHFEVTYVQNQWDMPHHDSSQFFQPPPPADIPKQLVAEGHYSNVTADGFQPSQPVKPIFPWEEAQRTAPERAFPDYVAPPPQPEPEPAPAAPPTVTRVFPPEQTTAPARELGAVYSNAWDDIPSIQRYASRLMGVKPPPKADPTPVPEPPKPEKEWSWDRNRGEADASSRDGDDEDDEEEESPDQEKEKVKPPTTVGSGQSTGLGSNGTNGTSRPKLGSRSASRSSGSRSGSFSRSSATTATSPAAQTLKSSPGVSVPGRNGNATLRGYGAYLAEKRKSQGALEGHVDARSRVATIGAGTPAFMYPLGIEPQLPGLIWAPAPDVVNAVGDDEASLPSLAEPSFEFTRPSHITLSTVTSLSVAGTLGSTLDVLSHTRTISSENDMTDDSSLPPSPGVSSSELERSPPPPPARTFDEARSVDNFKRDSHEVLARFLRMGSWGGETP